MFAVLAMSRKGYCVYVDRARYSWIRFRSLLCNQIAIWGHDKEWKTWVIYVGIYSFFVRWKEDSRIETQNFAVLC